METIISAKNVNKHYGKKQVLNDVSFTVNKGEIIGVIGSNGAGKTTLLRSLLGLSNFKGSINVNGLNPMRDHKKLMESVSFIADTATLPSWITCQQLLMYIDGIHPNFDINKAKAFITDTNLCMNMKVSTMSKGMVTQLHLALVMAIDSSLLVLDEPTLGLDIIRRKVFYNQLLDDYYNDNNTIIITTHQIEEIERILTRVIFIDKGNIIADIEVSNIEEKYIQVTANNAHKNELDALGPIYVSKGLTGDVYLFEAVDKAELIAFGTTAIPELADLFIALTKNTNKEATYA